MLSFEHTVLYRVPEGSILCHILFACYVADVPANVHPEFLAFADDIKIFRRVKTPSDVTVLQVEIDDLVEWSKVRRLTLNPAKCRVVTFTLRTSSVAACFRGAYLSPPSRILPLARCSQTKHICCPLSN